MLLEWKIAGVIASVTALFAATDAVGQSLGPWTQMGVAGGALGILFYIVAKRDPAIAKTHAEAIEKAAEMNASAVRDNAHEMRGSCERIESAIVEQSKILNANADRTHQLLADQIKRGEK